MAGDQFQGTSGRQPAVGRVPNHTLAPHHGETFELGHVVVKIFTLFISGFQPNIVWSKNTHNVYGLLLIYTNG